MSNVSVIVLSSDKYSDYWSFFFRLKKKYWPECPYPTYLVTEKKKTKNAMTINVRSPIWTKRFRDALEQIKEDYVILMLEDYFIRDYVNQKRISEVVNLIINNPNIIVFNFEQNYRQAENCNIPGWKRQRNKQVYLNSTQPSLWNKQLLIERLEYDQDPWEWELTVVDSPYDHLINTDTMIIDTGYRYGRPFGVMKGKMTDECIRFLLSERLL
jgi:hypothetical protein